MPKMLIVRDWKVLCLDFATFSILQRTCNLFFQRKVATIVHCSWYDSGEHGPSKLAVLAGSLMSSFIPSWGPGIFSGIPCRLAHFGWLPSWGTEDLYGVLWGRRYFNGLLRVFENPWADKWFEGFSLPSRGPMRERCTNPSNPDHDKSVEMRRYRTFCRWEFPSPNPF
jgi:hypothetical protein